MPEVTQLTLAVDSRQVRTATGDLGKLASAGKSAEKEAGALAKAYQSVGRVFGAVAASVLAREVIQAADAYKNMNARLQLVTGSMSELVAAQQGVFDISQRTRVSLGQTTDLFTSLARSTETLGVSQQDLLKVTESINQALIISGTSAAGAQAALVQLGQGFSSGVLRGEELNSVLEQAPRLARAMADGLGVPVGKLRELGQAGQLTAEKVFAALQKSSTALQSEFERMPLTVEQATTQAGNSLTRLIGVIDKATGATSLLAGGLAGIARGMDALVDLPKLADLAGLASDLTDAKQYLDRLKEAKASPWAPLAPDLDAQIAEAERKFAEARRRFKTADGRLGTSAAEDQSTAEARRLGIVPKASTAGFVDTSTISGIQARIKELKELRDKAKVGSDEFKRLAADIKTYEERLKKLLPSNREKKDDAKEVFTNYREQIAQRVGSLLENSDATQAQVFTDTLKQLDDLFFTGSLSAEQYESALKKLTGATSSAEGETSKFVAEQQRLAELLAGTESAGIEKQRQDMELLTKALIEGRIKEGEYLEAVSARLGLVAEKTKEAKSFAEELGLSFSSAFEDAVVGGKSFGDVLKGLADDITRLIVRQQVTKPLADAAGSFDWGSLFSSLVPSANGNVFSNAPGLSAYSGTVVSKPTIFPFARGAGLMGEAGPEAILPLQRGSDGKLGVAGGSGGKVTVNVINQGGGSLSVTGQTQRTNADGSMSIDVMVEALQGILADNVANGSGAMARAMEGRYGLRPSMGG